MDLDSNSEESSLHSLTDLFGDEPAAPPLRLPSEDEGGAGVAVDDEDTAHQNREDAISEAQSKVKCLDFLAPMEQEKAPQ